MVVLKRIILLIPVVLFLLSCATSYNKNAGGSHIRYRQNTFDIYTAYFSKDKIELFWKDGDGKKLTSISNLKKYIEKEKRQLVFATNAGMYMPDNSPEGLYMENGKELIPINLKKSDNANFYLKPNGIFLITKTEAKIIPSTDFEKYRSQTLFATQSGPMLVIDGEINPLFTKGSANTYIRSGVGITKEGKIVFAISNNMINFYDFADFFKNDLGCDNALFLDGAISRMYLPEIGRNDLDGNFGAMIGITVAK